MNLYEALEKLNGEKDYLRGVSYRVQWWTGDRDGSRTGRAGVLHEGDWKTLGEGINNLLRQGISRITIEVIKK